MEEKKGRGLGRRGPARGGPARPGAHLPQREEVVAPPTEAEAQQLVAQRLREGRARQEAGDDAVPERGRFHRRRLCKAKTAGEGRRGPAAAAGRGWRGAVPCRTVAERLPAAPGRCRPLPQRRIPEGGAELGARLPFPALRPRRRRRGPAPLGAHLAPLRQPPPDYSSRRSPRRPPDQSDRAEGGAALRWPMGEGEGRSAATKCQ